MDIEDRRIKLDLLHGFGSSTSKGYKDCVGILEDEGNKKLLFPISKYIGVKQIENSDMSFLKLSDHLDQIMCMTVSPSKQFVAVCEKTNDDQDDTKKLCPTVYVYDIKANLLKNSSGHEKKSFPYSETNVNHFSALSFSSEPHPRFLLCLTEAPENKLVFIDIVGSKKNYASCIINQNITKISISPQDTHLVAISGPNCFKILRVQESTFVYMAESIKRLTQQQNFTDHCWFDEGRIALANDQGEIFTIYNNEVEQFIQVGLERIGSCITSIKSYSKGLIVGGKVGNFSIWIKDENPQKILDRRSEDDKYELVQLKCWRSERADEVSALDISQNDDLLAVAFNNNDIATYDISKLIPVVVETLDQMKRNLRTLEKRVKFQYIFKGSHYGPITSMDICIQRPLIVTCSNYDSTIRIWNYINYKCELVRKFDVKESSNSQQNMKPLLSVGFHPSGYYISAGFIDKFRIYHVLHDSLKLFQEKQIKNVSFTKFSNGGQYLAAAAPRQQSQKTNSYEITIFDSYTLEIIATLKGPNNRVSEINWGPGDTFIQCCSIDGLIYEWSSGKQWQRRERPPTSQHLTSIMYNEQNGLTVVCGGEENTGIIVETKERPEPGAGDYSESIHLPNYRITQMAFLRSYFNYTGIVAGTNCGKIKVWSHNLHLNQGMPFETIPCHDGEITNIRVSPSGRHVFTTGNDGIIFIFQVSEITGDGEVITAQSKPKQLQEHINPKSLCVDDTLADIVMVPKQDIDSYIKEREKVLIQFEDYQIRKQEEMEDTKRRHEKQLQDQEEKNKKGLEKWQFDYTKLQNSKEQLQKEAQILIQNTEQSHLDQVAELDKLYEAKLAYENEKYQQLDQQKQEIRQNFEQEIKDIEQRHDKTLRILKSEFVEQFQKVNKIYSNTKDTAHDIHKQYEERLHQLEEEHELEISNLVNKYEMVDKQRENQISERNKRISELDETKNHVLQKQEIYEKNEKENKEKIQDLLSEVSKLKSIINQDEDDIKKRDLTIKEKDKSISNLKYKISDLQKTKHVLSFRTTEMRKSLEPKEAQIEKLKEELFKLENEFQSILKNYQLQNDKMKKMQSQIDTLNNNLQKEIIIRKSSESLHNKMVMDIYNIVKKNDVNEQVNGMKYLYQEYVQELKIHHGKSDPKSVEEMGRMIGQLEKSIFQINKTTGKVIIRREKEIHKKTKENAELIYDLNDIRKENKELKAELSNLRILYETSEKEKKKLEDELQKANRPGNQRRLLANSQSQANVQGSDPFASLNKDFSQSASKPLLTQKGKIVKGSNFDLKTLGTFDKAKMMDLMAEVEMNAQRRAQAEEQLSNVKNKVRAYMQENNWQDDQLYREVSNAMDGDNLFRLPQINN